MIIDNFNFCNEKVNIIFTGAMYIFNSPFFGLICYAVRDYEKREDNKEFFTIYWNNSRCSNAYNNTILERAKKRIVKNENKHVATSVMFEEVETDLNEKFIEVTVKDR